MTTKELLTVFLEGEPESMHELDRRRFLAYAIRCAKKDKYIDTKAMLEHGVSAETVEELECIFEWIRSTVDYLTCKG